MDKQRAIIIWIIMVVFITVFAYILGASWMWAIIIGILLVAALVGGATGFMYWQQKKMITNAAKFNIDLKNGNKINPADLRRMYFSGGQARKDALFIASRAMQCSIKEAEKQLSGKISKQAANQEMAKHQHKGKGKQRSPR